jgi:hypothetical protein
MVLSDQRTPYSIMYVWAAFEAKSPPTRQDLVTTVPCSFKESLKNVENAILAKIKAWLE